MGSQPLTKLLEEVRSIPNHELGRKVRESGRPTEMAILGKVIPSNKILEIRQKPGYWISRCCDLSPTKMTFQVTNGEIHSVVVSLVNGKLKVVDNQDTLNIDTVEGLRKHILMLAKVEQ